MTNQIQINLNQTKPLVCGCGNETFEQIHFIRVIPALLSPTQKAEMYPIPAFRCTNCQKMAEIKEKKTAILP
jgi:hypothetical protein